MPRPAVLACLAIAVLTCASRADDGPKDPDKIRKGTFYCQIQGREISRESFEIRNDGWWAKGKLDIGAVKNEYELTERVTEDRKKKSFEVKTVQNGTPVEFTGTLTPESYDLVAKVNGEEKKGGLSLEGKTRPIPYINLLWVFYVDVGRELVARAEKGELTPGTRLDVVEIGAAQSFDMEVRESKTFAQTVEGATYPLRYFELTIAGSVSARLVTSQSGIPLWFGVLAQSLDMYAEGYEAFRPEWTRTPVTMIPMRDGVKLAADVLLPKAPGKVPTILMRTPYGRHTESGMKGPFYTSKGYAVVAQDVRGRFDSEGEFRPAFNEANDGSDTIDWIAAQPWSDGTVGMIGASYVGWVQWLAASTGNPRLKAIVPQVSPPDPHENIPYEGGVFTLSSGWWAVAAELIAKGEAITGSKVEWLNAMATRPLVDLDTALGVTKSPFLDEWLSHPPEDPYWEPIRYQQKFASIDVPSLNISGWYDGDQPGAPLNFAGMRKHGKSERARKGTMLVMGPWTHFFNGQSKLGEFDFGPGAIIDLDSLCLRFFDRYVKGIENGIENEDPVRVFSMFANEWRNEKDWPLPQTQWTKLYLGGPGKANKREGGGTLALEAQEGPPDRYAFDPLAKFEKTIDFNDMSGKQLSEDAYLQGDDETTLDYVSPPLAEPVEVIGPITATLSVSTDAVDTDFGVVLLRVDAAGKTTGVRGGLQRLKYRKGWNKPSLAKPGDVSTVTIDCWASGLRFDKGERIALMVTSDFFPGYARNLNTNEPDATATKGVVANQTVFHDKARPSFVTLPVIPRDGSKGIRFEGAAATPER